MAGATITSLGRRAKYGLINTDRDQAMIFHLGMSGRWRVDPQELLPHDHLVIETDAGRRVALNDPRRFGSVDLWPSSDIGSFPAFIGLGPEPLGPELTAAGLKQALHGRRASIKLMLLDQRIVAGLGNIYVCEALNRAGINPQRPAGQVGRAALARLVPAIRAVLAEAIAAGGSTIRDYLQPDGELGYFANSWRVYGREGQRCPCGGTVERFAQGGRSSWWCAKCQK